ncbi:hypothetical protein [Natronosalvus halobius]|uniref:hypothetical protein n=1 Tax=Natronosalvus halobius TaxID=2953746 RepID=UPI00209F70BA|nr:hypothetical protein [Natronosalvus halobius]USZ72288.1 hypothetical protein NGM15_02970 [Natronosalvus halobius]
MTNALTPRPTTSRIGTVEQAAVTAYDALEAAGCTSIETKVPYQSRATWIVPAATDQGRRHVHIDPRTGHTKIARQD